MYIMHPIIFVSYLNSTPKDEPRLIADDQDRKGKNGGIVP